MPRGGARPGTGGRRLGAGRPIGSQNARTKSIHARLEEVRQIFDEIVPDKSLIRAIWLRALKGDSASLRLCAEYKWGKVREAPDLTPEPVTDGRVFISTLSDGTPALSSDHPDHGRVSAQLAPPPSGIATTKKDPEDPK